MLLWMVDPGLEVGHVEVQLHNMTALNLIPWPGIIWSQEMQWCISYKVHRADFKQNIAAFIVWEKLCISLITEAGITSQTGEFGTD